MLRQRLVEYRKLWIPALAVAVLVASILVVGSMFGGGSASAAASPGVTERISVEGTNTELQQDSYTPSISADGRFVAFSTYAPIDDLDGDNDGSEYEANRDSDIYVRDTVTKTTVWVSHGFDLEPEGDDILRAPSNGDSFNPSISADGRFIAFQTTSSNIPLEGAGTEPRIVICDRNPDGQGPLLNQCLYTVVSRPTDRASEPSLSGDASLLAYEHTNLGSSNRPSRIVLVTLNRTPEGSIPVPAIPGDFVDVVGPDTIEADDDGDGDLDTHTRYGAESSALSANGTHLGFVGTYGVDATRRVWVLFDFDVTTGALTRLDGRAASGPVARNNRLFLDVALSGDGRRYAVREDTFSSSAAPFIHLFDRDPDGDSLFGPAGVSGSPGPEPFRVEIASRNVDNATVGAIQPAFSADGRYMAFVTDAPNVHNGKDRATLNTSCVNPPVIGSHEVPLEEGQGAEEAPAGVPAPRAAPAALEIPAEMPAREPAQAPTNPSTGISTCDIVVRDLVVDRARELAGQPRLPAELASPSQFQTCLDTSPSPSPNPDVTCEGNRDSQQPVLAANGSAVAFSSAAFDLIGNEDDNGRVDVYLRRFTPTVRGDAVDFGEVPLTKELIRPVTVSHVGFGPLEIKSVSIGGVNATDFTLEGQNCLGTTLHGTDLCIVGVKFAPTALGARSATLVITLANATPAGGTVGIPLRGTGIPEPPPGFEADPDPLAFGDRGVLFASPPQAVTVTNTGDGRMRITDVKFVGAALVSFPGDYTITANTCTGTILSPGQTCQVTVVHKPRAVGSRPSTLQFTEGFEETTTHEVTVTGGGTAPLLAVSPPLNQAGHVSQVSGTNFPPGSTVLVTLDRMVGGPAPVVVNANGEFTVALLIFPHTATGKRPLRAKVTQAPSPGLDAPLEATFDYLVVPGSLQPPDFAVRK